MPIWLLFWIFYTVDSDSEKVTIEVDISFYLFIYYRPQRSNVFTRVCHSVHRGVSGRPPPGRHPPRQTPTLGRHPPRQTPPYPPTPPVMATAADDTHPTGMYSCYCLQRSCGKVIFSQVCVKNSVHRGIGSVSVHAGIHTPWADTPLQTPPCWDRHGYCCGRYASYWNAFLFLYSFYLMFHEKYNCAPSPTTKVQLHSPVATFI